MRLRFSLVRAAASVLALGLVPLAGFAQTTTGRILGTTHDQSGAVVAGATITVTDVQRGVSRSMTTDQAGVYVFPDLSPGVYKLRAEAKGFATVERPSIQVQVATDVTADVTFQAGNVSETITVNEEVPLINTVSATLGGTLTNKEIIELPLNGRNYENLLQLRPGVIRYPGGGFSTTSANGLRAEDNAYLVDGLFNSEPFSGQSIINGAGIAGDSATILPVDAIQEFNLQQNPPAEYGWKPGAVVNVGLKSGTNSFHGTGYIFGRDTPLDARNFFNPVTQEKNPRNLEQFGGSVGGPILKDKLFFFGAYEGQRYTVGNTGQISTPATVSLGGDPANSLVDAIAALQALAIPVSPASLQIGGCQLGPPITCNGSGFPANDGTNPAGSTTIDFGLPNTVSSDNAVGKIDYHINERHTLSGMYFFGNNSGTVSDASQLQTKWLTDIHTRAQVVGATWTWVPSSRWVNVVRFGYNRLYQPTFVADHNVQATAYGLDTGITNPLYGGLPRINIAPFYIFPQELGGFNWPKIQGPDDRYQFVDQLSYVRGRHSLKFGIETHRDAFNGGAYGGGRGRIKFGFGVNDVFPGATSLEDFFAGVPDKASQLVGDPTRDIHNWGYATFAQDDWRVRPNLTFNFGLRYEVNTVISDAKNQLGNFDPACGVVQVGIPDCLGRKRAGPYNGDHVDFAPRLGFSWDPWGSGNTVIRGGGGIIYETLNWESYLAFNNALGLSTIPTGAIINGSGGTAGGTIAVGTVNFPGSALNWDPAVTGIPGPVFPATAIDCFANPCSILGVDPRLKTPYVWNWTLNVQHAFNSKLSLEVAYVGNHGSKLVGIRDINQVDPNSPAEIACGHCEQNGRPFNAAFPYLSNIYWMANIYRSNYNGLQVTFTGRNYHGLSFIAGYTYSHALDNVGANWDFGAGLGLPQDSTNPQAEYASSDFDLRHRFTLSMNYAFPSKKSFLQALEGWEINTIVTLAAAQPWGPMDAGTDVSLTGENNDRWNFFGNPSNFTSGANPIPFFAFGDPAMPAACINDATATNAIASLQAFGCYAVGNSVMIPPAFGTFGTMGRNIFRDSGFRNVDFSVVKNWRFADRYGIQFRAEFFNVFNHPNFANPFGGQNGWAHNDPSAPGPGGFGCGCATPDVAASNPVIGSGGARAVQLGVKFTF